MADFSIIICTHNRPYQLRECLRNLAIASLSIEKIKFEILVVDNLSSLENRRFNEELISSLPGVKYVFEVQLGLSYARNRGARESTANWLIYIDDDTYVFPDFCERLLVVLPEADYPCIGGRIYPCFESPKPRWLPVDFKLIDFWPTNDLSPIPDTDKVLGGLMAIDKKLLAEVGYFPTSLGMSGQLIAYGEETYVQQKIQQLGHKIGYDPKWQAYHVVGKHKYQWQWHIQSYFAKGRDSYGLTYEDYSVRELIFDGLNVLFERLPKGIAKLILRRHYYWQNLVLEVMKPLAFAWGKWQRVRQLTAK